LSVVGAARGFCGLLTNSLYHVGGVKHFRAEAIKLSSAAPVWLQLDGENVCPLPARLSVQRRGLRVICPARP
jgi:diacylglycerol kinase family enzyme